MTFVGFKRLTISVGGTTPKTYVVEGSENKGATVSAEITGLAKEKTKVYGSDIAYYVSQKGTGDVSVDFGLLDLPEEVNDAILGYKVANGISFVGEDTEPPYCSVLLESEDMGGDTALIGFFKGKFSRDGAAMNTLTGDAFEPDADTYTFSAIASDKTGDQKGQTMAKYVGNETTSITALKSMVIPIAQG